MITQITKKTLKLLRWISDESVKTITQPSFVLNNYKGGDTICFVLAGYKEYLWDVVFRRLKVFCPNDIEICILSSGCYSEKLKSIAEVNSWTYLSFKHNCVTQVLNSAIYFFPNAQKIFKMDEDIFVTKGCFHSIQKTHELAKDKYFPCFSAPLIPINGFGYSHILSLLGKTEEYSALFGQPKVGAGKSQAIESNANTAIYMWNLGAGIDDLNRICQENHNFGLDTDNYLVCPIRFSIGFIYFERKIIEEFGFFPVKKGTCLGDDEYYLCNLAMSESRAIIVSKSTVVGHLAFGGQNKKMEEYFHANKQRFDL